jgi:NAD-dependent protein deacetylases, SIR2 family
MRGALEQTAKILRESENNVFLGGAGVSNAAQISNSLLIPIHGRAQAARGICENSVKTAKLFPWLDI